MVRMRGFEEAAKQAGHVGMFYTLTYPSKFHRFTTFVPFLNVAKYSLMASALLNLTMTAARTGIYFYSFLLTKKMN
ncbi:MAG TPA: replication endonuclease [Thiolinea sp.]|nr:replication endonuclease [uncultured Thiothrix sp.]HMT92649.1 replication endonuclease [Thiolinea sp.]